MSFSPYRVEHSDGKYWVCISNIDRDATRIICIDSVDANELCSYLTKHHEKYMEYKLKHDLELDKEIQERMRTLPPGNQTLDQLSGNLKGD